VLSSASLRPRRAKQIKMAIAAQQNKRPAAPASTGINGNDDSPFTSSESMPAGGSVLRPTVANISSVVNVGDGDNGDELDDDNNTVVVPSLVVVVVVGEFFVVVGGDLVGGDFVVVALVVVVDLAVVVVVVVVVVGNDAVSFVVVVVGLTVNCFVVVVVGGSLVATGPAVSGTINALLQQEALLHKGIIGSSGGNELTQSISCPIIDPP